MRLSDFENEEALDVLADIIEPAAEIFQDQKIVKVFRNNGKPIEAIRIMLKDHKKSVIEILAALDGVPVNEYHCNVLTLPVKLLEILNDKELTSFFTLQAASTGQSSSGVPMGNTKAKEK